MVVKEQIVLGLWLTRFGMHRWENKINSLLNDGYNLIQCDVTRYLLRTFGCAHLEKYEPVVKEAKVAPKKTKTTK